MKVLRIALLFATRARQKELMTQSLETQSAAQTYQVQLLAGLETLKASGSEDRGSSFR